MKVGDKFYITEEAVYKSSLPKEFANTIQTALDVRKQFIDFDDGEYSWFVVKKYCLPVTSLLQELV